MIDPEKLLGKVLSSGVKGIKKGKKKKKKHKKSDDMMSGLLGGLTSGKGLITAIGLGVGAYEILKNKPASDSGTVQQPHHTSTPPPPPIPSKTSAAPPPPIPGKQNGDKAITYSPKTDEEIAIRLIQIMVASAYADGKMDSEEEAQILGQMQEQDLTSEEKQFLLAQLHAPKTIAELTEGIEEPLIAQTMYSLAVSAVIIDTPEERQWLDELAKALSISENVKQFIEAEM